MKKIGIILLSLFLCLLILFIGFLLYKKIDQGIQARAYASMEKLDTSKAKTLPVDERDVLKTYTHQLTTYQGFETDLLKAAIHYSNQMPLDGIYVMYHEEDTFLVHSFQDFEKSQSVKDVEDTFIILWPKSLNLETDALGELYESNDYYYLKVIIKNSDPLLFDFNVFSLKISK
jgi:hypothetical protein